MITKPYNFLKQPQDIFWNLLAHACVGIPAAYKVGKAVVPPIFFQNHVFHPPSSSTPTGSSSNVDATLGTSFQKAASNLQEDKYALPLLFMVAILAWLSLKKETQFTTFNAHMPITKYLSEKEIIVYQGNKTTRITVEPLVLSEKKNERSWKWWPLKMFTN